MTRPAAVDVMKEFNQESILKWEARARYPDNFLRWFLFNPKYDEHKEVNYHEILEKVQ